MKIKRLISTILVMMLLISSLATNAYALDGCDGVLDTGEIELESYIEWNTFKSKIDGLGSAVLDELRSAEERGILPEMYPVGTDRLVVKTDLGFYAFKIGSDGSYTSLDSLHFAHFGSYKDGTLSYVGTGTPTDSASGNHNYYDGRCCIFKSLQDYGYYKGKFFIIGKGSSTYSSDDCHEEAFTGGTVSTDSVQSGYVIYLFNDTGNTGFELACHSYTTNSSEQSLNMYWGTDSVYFLGRSSGGRNGTKYEYMLQEYSFDKAAKSKSHSTFEIYSGYPCSGTVDTIAGRAETLSNTAISINKDHMYPYGKLKYGYTDRDKDYWYYSTMLATYAEDDNGTRSIKPSGGIISMHDMLGGAPRCYDNDYSSSYALYDSTGNVMNIGSSNLSENQKEEFKARLAEECNKVGIPIYGYVSWVRNSNNFDDVTWSTTRKTRIDASGNVYNDGALRLYKPYRPQLGTDGKYILNTTRTFTIGGGLNKNATQLTFENLSLGTDANIKVYGVPVSGDKVLLETIDYTKNSLGTYTTPIYKYGLIELVWTAGASTSGRGEGFKVTDVKFGQYGTLSSVSEFVDYGKVHCPHIGFSGFVEATYPTISKSTTTKTYDVSYSNLGDYRTNVLLEKGVTIENGTVIHFQNKGTTSTSTSYNAANYDCYLRFVGGGTTYSVTSESNSLDGTFKGPSGTYDVYGYVYNTGKYYQFTASFTATKYTHKTSTETKSIASKSTTTAITDKFTSKHTSTHTYASAKPEGVQYVSLGTYTLNRGDTIVTSFTKTSGNSRFTYSYLPIYYKTSDSTSYSSLSTYNNYYTYTGNTATVELFVYHQYYSNASYKWKDGDSITINIYPAILRTSKTLTGADFQNTTTQYMCNSYEDTSFRYRLVYYDSNQYTGSNYSYCYIYINGSRYYPNTSDLTFITSSNDRSYCGYYYLYNANYKPPTDAELGTIYVYDTPASYTYNGKKTLGKIQWNAPNISGYTFKAADIDYTITFTDTYGYYGIDNLNLTAMNSAKTATYKYTSTKKSASQTIYAQAGGECSVSAKITYYYYDNAGTECKRYSPSVPQTLTFDIVALDGHFTNVKISEYKVPSGMTLKIDGTTITSSTKQTGWKNNNKLTATLEIPGSSTYGMYFVQSLDDVIKYTLETKRIYDKTSYYASNGSANLGKASVSMDSDGNVTVNTGKATITGASNGYVKFVPTFQSTSTYNDNHNGVKNGTATGLRDLSTMSNSTSDYYSKAFNTTMGYWAATSDTVTISVTPNYDTRNSNLYAPSGYVVGAYYIVKASNIPDSKIKTYSYDDTNLVYDASKEVVYGKNAISTAKSNGGTLVANNNTPLTKSNSDSYSSSNSYYTVVKVGKVTTGTSQYTYSPEITITGGSSVQATTSNVGIIKPGTKKYTSLNTWGSTSVMESSTENNSWTKTMPYVYVAGYKKSTATDTAVASSTAYSNMTQPTNIAIDKNTYKTTDWSGEKQFLDGRYGVPRIVYQTIVGSNDGSKLQRVDVLRKHADGSISNLASLPVSGTETWFKSYSYSSNKDDDRPCQIYHIGNDLMYVGASDVDANSGGTDGKSLAWLRTGHWHLKGSADEIEGITQGGINNPVKTMETDDADTEIVVNELDMNAKSWQMGHNIKDGKVTDQKLSDDVKKELREINLGTVTFIKGDGEQYKYVPVGTYGVDADTLDGTRLKYGTRYVDIYAYDDNQVEIEVLTSMIGNKNINGTTSGSLSTGEHIFTGNVTVDGVSVPVVLQVIVVERPKTSGKTTITLTD